MSNPLRPIGEVLTTSAAADPDRPAVTCEGVTITRDELDRRSNRLARAYASFGVSQGDLVTIGLRNGIEFYVSCYATWKLGAVPQPVSWRLPARERRQIIELADPPLVVGLDEQHADRHTVPAGFEPDAALSDAPLPATVPPAWKALTSGGSTGRPKVIVSGSAGAIAPEAAQRRFFMQPEHVQLVPGPLYHNGPFSYSMLGSFLGQHLLVLPRFDAEAALEAIEQHRVGFVLLVPTMMLRMWRAIEAAPGRYDLSSLEVVWHMAAPCPPWLKERWIDLVGGSHLFELYGGTEAQAMTVISGDEWLAHPGSVGRVAEGQMKVVDAAGDAVPQGQVGEIYMRKAPGAPDTYRYIGAEAKVLDDGWESLGDIGWIDAGGYLHLTDRISDMILVGGANIYPAEVEAALSEHPLVASSAVVGLPDEDLGHHLHAVVEATQALTGDELRTFLLERVEPHKIPRSFRFVTETLRDDAGKVRRSAVREREIELQRG